MLFLIIITLCMILPIPGDAGIDQPVIRVDSREHDFGSIGDLETVGHTFQLENAGVSPLVIHEVEVDRNCLVLSGNQVVELAPGEHFGLQVRFAPNASAHGQ